MAASTPTDGKTCSSALVFNNDEAHSAKTSPKRTRAKKSNEASKGPIGFEDKLWQDAGKTVEAVA